MHYPRLAASMYADFVGVIMPSMPGAALAEKIGDTVQKASRAVHRAKDFIQDTTEHTAEIISPGMRMLKVAESIQDDIDSEEIIKAEKESVWKTLASGGPKDIERLRTTAIDYATRGWEVRSESQEYPPNAAGEVRTVITVFGRDRMPPDPAAVAVAKERVARKTYDPVLALGDACMVAYIIRQIPALAGMAMSIFSAIWKEGAPGEFT